MLLSLVHVLASQARQQAVELLGSQHGPRALDLPKSAAAGHSYLRHVVQLCVTARSGIVPGAKHFVDSVPIY